MTFLRCWISSLYNLSFLSLFSIYSSYSSLMSIAGSPLMLASLLLGLEVLSWLTNLLDIISGEVSEKEGFDKSLSFSPFFRGDLVSDIVVWGVCDASITVFDRFAFYFENFSIIVFSSSPVIVCLPFLIFYFTIVFRCLSFNNADWVVLCVSDSCFLGGANIGFYMII